MEKTHVTILPANVMVRIYEINPSQTDFKMNIIKATNNQNSVKSYSLMANDPIQIEISNVLKKFDIIYDRKGEGKSAKSEQQIISMINVALAYRAVYLFMARSLRSGLGKSRVFQKNEYERIFNSKLLEEESRSKFHEFCFRLIIANGILNSVRDLVQQHDEKYIKELPIFKKSTYYLAGYMYADQKEKFEEVFKKMTEAYDSENEQRVKGEKFSLKIEKIVSEAFDAVIARFTRFYTNLKGVDKTDIDNLLKNKAFDTAYRKELETMGATLPNEED